MKPTDTEKERQGITLTKFFGIDYICDMATYLGAVKKSKVSSTNQMEKSLSIIIRELDKLDATGEFKGVYWGWVNFMQLEGEMRSALERIKRQNK